MIKVRLKLLSCNRRKRDDKITNNYSKTKDSSESSSCSHRSFINNNNSSVGIWCFATRCRVYVCKDRSRDERGVCLYSIIIWIKPLVLNFYCGVREILNSLCMLSLLFAFNVATSIRDNFLYIFWFAFLRDNRRKIILNSIKFYYRKC